MIVTADPLGDYNATSQILRYSALARDVAIPRAPSATESILSGTLRSSRGSANGRGSSDLAANEELEKAVAEIERLTVENENLAVHLAEEEICRTELEMQLKSCEERCLIVEQDVREECWAEMDERMEEERKRWQNAWDDQVRSAAFSTYFSNLANPYRPVVMMSIWTRRLSYCPAASKVRILTQSSPHLISNTLLYSLRRSSSRV